MLRTGTYVPSHLFCLAFTYDAYIVGLLVCLLACLFTLQLALQYSTVLPQSTHQAPGGPAPLHSPSLLAAVCTLSVSPCASSVCQTFSWLEKYVRAMHDDVVVVPAPPPPPPAPGSGSSKRVHSAGSLVVSGMVTVAHAPPDRVVLTWRSAPAADLVADSLVAVISHADVSAASIRVRVDCCGGGGGARHGTKRSRGVVEEEHGSHDGGHHDTHDGVAAATASGGITATPAPVVAAVEAWASETAETAVPGALASSPAAKFLEELQAAYSATVVTS